MDISSALSAITKRPFSIISKLILEFTLVRSLSDVDFANKHFALKMIAKAIFVVTMIASNCNAQFAMPSLLKISYYFTTLRNTIMERVVHENNVFQKLVKENEIHEFPNDFCNISYFLFS